MVDNIALLVDVVKVALDAFGVREPEFFERDFNKTKIPSELVEKIKTSIKQKTGS